MKRTITAFLLIMMIALCAFNSEAGAPRIRIPEPNVTLKDAMEGEIVTYEFEVLNDGDATLEIQSVRPG